MKAGCEPGSASRGASAAKARYQAVIKIGLDDNPIKQTRDITEGIGYACALLQDEYGWTARQVEGVLERIIDEITDAEEARLGR